MRVDVHVKCSLRWPTLTKTKMYRQNIVKFSNATMFQEDHLMSTPVHV